MTDTVFKKKKKKKFLWIMDSYVFSMEKDILKNGYDDKCLNTGSCAPISHKL